MNTPTLDQDTIGGDGSVISEAEMKNISAPNEEETIPVNYASYSKRGGNTRNAGGVNYAMYADSGDENIVHAGGVNYAKYAGRNKLTREEIQEVIRSPEYLPEQLQQIINLLGIIELSKSLLPEIIEFAKQRGGGGADILQTGASAAIKKGLNEWLEKSKSADGKLSTSMKVAQFAIRNIEVLLELYNSKKILDRAKPLQLSTRNKAKIVARHMFDGLVSKIPLVGQVADFFFNSSLKSVGALEDQINKHKETLRSYYGVPELYIDEPTKGLEYYKNLQLQQQVPQINY